MREICAILKWRLSMRSGMSERSELELEYVLSNSSPTKTNVSKTDFDCYQNISLTNRKQFQFLSVFMSDSLKFSRARIWLYWWPSLNESNHDTKKDHLFHHFVCFLIIWTYCYLIVSLFGEICAIYGFGWDDENSRIKVPTE